MPEEPKNLGANVPPPGDFVMLGPQVKSAITHQDGKSFEVFLVKGKKGTSAVVIPSGDAKSIAAARAQLGKDSNRATVVGGVVHISLAKAAASRCIIF